MSEFPTSVPAFSARLVNERVERLVERFRESFRLVIRAAMQDKYPPLSEPPPDRDEELAFLEPLAPMFWAQAMDMNLSEPLRARAQRQLMRWMELRRNGVGEEG